MRYKSSSVTTRKFRASFCPAMNQMIRPMMGRAMSAISQVSRSTPAMLVRHWYMAMMVTAQIADSSRTYSAWKAMRCSKSEVRSVWLVIGVLGCLSEMLGRALRVALFFLAKNFFEFGHGRAALGIPPSRDEREIASSCFLYRNTAFIYSPNYLCDVAGIDWFFFHFGHRTLAALKNHLNFLKHFCLKTCAGRRQ